MRVTHLVTGPLSGGAALGAIALHEGLLSIGVRSRIVTDLAAASPVDHIDHSAWTPFPATEARLRSRFDTSYLRLAHPRRPRTTFSVALAGAPVWRHPWVRSADVLNLHWINGGFVALRDIDRIPGSLVWTMRDMWTFTGGCHYSLQCARHRAQCGACPQLHSADALDISRRQHLAKDILYSSRKITFVAISDWLYRESLSSSLLGNQDVRSIPNCIDTIRFRLKSRVHARASLGIAATEPVVVMGAGDILGYYKGFEYAKAVFHRLGAAYRAVLFGRNSERVARELPNAIGLGIMSEAEELAKIYAAGDCFLAPSTQEAFGKTVAEALACGTPAVVFDGTGPASIVTHKGTGYLAKPFSIPDLEAGIKWCCDLSRTHPERRESLRTSVVERFDAKVVAQLYRQLYGELLLSRAPGRNSA